MPPPRLGSVHAPESSLHHQYRHHRLCPHLRQRSGRRHTATVWRRVRAAWQQSHTPCFCHGSKRAGCRKGGRTGRTVSVVFLLTHDDVLYFESQAEAGAATADTGGPRQGPTRSRRRCTDGLSPRHGRAPSDTEAGGGIARASSPHAMCRSPLQSIPLARPATTAWRKSAGGSRDEPQQA